MVSGDDAKFREGMLYVVEITTPHYKGGHSTPMSYENALDYQKMCERAYHTAVIRTWKRK